MSKPTRKNGRNGATQTAPRVSQSKTQNGNGHLDSDTTTTARLPVLKTYKIYIGGKFPRTESGRYYLLKNAKGQPIANVCLCSRKDFRDAVVAARAAQSSWAGKSAFNRGQILYRIAEMLEGRAAQFVDELVTSRVATSPSSTEVAKSIDRIHYYPGW